MSSISNLLATETITRLATRQFGENAFHNDRLSHSRECSSTSIDRGAIYFTYGVPGQRKTALGIYDRIEQESRANAGMNMLLNVALIFLGTIAGNLLVAGYFLYGVPLTAAGLLLALVMVWLERREQEFSKKLVDRPLY